MSESWEEVFDVASIDLVRTQPFFATLFLFLKRNFDETKTSTMSTNGKSLFVSPKFIQHFMDQYGKDAYKYIKFVLCHETLHCALRHITRRGSRDGMRWNIASDLVVNHMLAEICKSGNTGMLQPAEGVYIQDFGDHSVEEVYDSLGGNSDLSLKSDHGMWTELEDDPEVMDQEWEQNIIQAATVAKTMGMVPAGMERLIENMLYPKVDWKTYLANFLQPKPVDYTFSPPDRRFQDYALPTLGGNVIEDIVVAIDTSGSIDNAELSAFMSEMLGIMETYPEFEGTVASCDAAVHTWQPLNQETVDKIEIVGGGGTNFCPVFDAIEEKCLDISALVFFTDGYGTFPEQAPDYPVLWVMTTDVKPPFGDYVKLEL